MKDVILSILQIVASVSVALLVFAQGLTISPSLVVNYFKERNGIMLRSLCAALILVPAAALALILILKPAPGVAIGLGILVSCPPAPLMLATAPKKGGANPAFMATLHLSLAVLAFVTVPAALWLLSTPLGFHADVNLGSMAWILGRTILIPIGLGLIVHRAFPAAADRLGPILIKAGNVGVLIVLLFSLVVVFPALLNMDGWSYLVIAAVSAAALIIGQLLGPPDAQEKTALAVECGVRHPALAIAIGTTNFGAQRALPVLIPCVLTFIAMAMIYMAWRGKGVAGAAPAVTVGVS